MNRANPIVFILDLVPFLILGLQEPEKQHILACKIKLI